MVINGEEGATAIYAPVCNVSSVATVRHPHVGRFHCIDVASVHLGCTNI
jgi:hypothetical protein